MEPLIQGNKDGRYTVGVIRSNTLLCTVEVTSLIKVQPARDSNIRTRLTYPEGKAHLEGSLHVEPPRPEEVERKHTETIDRHTIAKPGEAGLKNTDQFKSTLGHRVAKPGEAGFNNTSGGAQQHPWLDTYSEGEAHL